MSSAFYFFTPYTDASEQSVGVFFKGLTEHSSQSHTRSRLSHLLQSNIAVINLWTEYRYKGYKYLRKAERKQLYANLQLIADDFDRFYANNARSAETVTSHIHALAPHATVNSNKIVLLQALMDYFSPHRGVYEYRDSSSFGRLLRDPSHEKLVGDCNQIVTLYIYLYSRYQNVRDLQVRILPGHVALHYGGIDIEATNSTYALYDKHQGNALLPVEEIVSINLLDTTDSYLSTHKVAAEDLLQASRFAFILSYERDIVTKNLATAYNNLIHSLMQRNDYAQALKFALASRDTALLTAVARNGVAYEMGRHNYAAARRFAEHAPERNDLIRNSWHAEGSHHYQAHRYHDALKAFKHVGDETLIRQCYEALFFDEQDKLGKNMTADTVKQYANTIKRMHIYAKKSGNQSLVRYVDDLHKYL